MPKKKTLPPPDDFSPEIPETAPAEELPEQQAEAVSETPLRHRRQISRKQTLSPMI